MHKKFLTNLGLILLLNLLIKPIYVFGIDKAIQNQVGTASYGIYFAVFNFSFLLTIILDFGITNFNNKNIAQNNHLLTKHFSSLFTLKLMLAAVYIIIVMITGFIIGYDNRLMKLLLIQGFNMFLLFFINYLRSNIAGLHLFKTDGLISVLDRTIMIILGVYMLRSGILYSENGIMYFVYAQTFAYSVAALTAFAVILKKTHSFKLKWNFPFSLMILKKSLPFAILTLLMSFYNRIDSVMIERMLPAGVGDVQSGIYAQGFRMLDAVNMIAFLVAGVLLPVFSRMLKHKESIEPLVKLVSRLLLTPAIVIGVGCFFYKHELIEYLYPWDKKEDFLIYAAHVNESAQIFSLIMLSFIAVSTTYIYGTLLTANGNMKQLNYMAASGMMLNIIFNYVLIRKYMEFGCAAFGSAISSMTTQFLTAGAQVLIAQRIFKFKVNYRLLFTFALFATGVVIINYCSQSLHFHYFAQRYNWLINFTIMCAGCGIWAFVTGMISIKAIFRFLKF